MKKVLIVLIIGILFTACGRNSTHDQTLDSNAAISDDVQQEFTVKENEKINHIFEEGKKPKYGVEKEIDEGSQMVYETKEQAEEYAIDLFKEKYPDVNLENYDIITEDESEEYWVVYARPKDKIYSIKGGGGPSVKFKKMDGSILEIGLQK